MTIEPQTFGIRQMLCKLSTPFICSKPNGLNSDQRGEEDRVKPLKEEKGSLKVCSMACLVS